ncbi:hypothetical protein VCRA2113O325_110130 [Vibrio crassostreae]|nr:hypothetical protein VCRA2113O322_110033 [Vibrio crassostreae]CAK1714923.1 hypothetical protein VCRA2113O326_110045 [Vibrio crassostreae]CAK2534805.1 hypothetical protein VCRA2113O321_110045 [Vibrio crassostreae]CAK2540000.1 hypothetical protein VCRA2113O323_110130 [Vibrio crassostreae]CAK2594147.1 hypothetical protein VCRA2113O325_110130 [Vibrio crassostreae]
MVSNVGDWEKFCESNGAPLDWEPWKGLSWSDDGVDSHTSLKKKENLNRFLLLCQRIELSIKKIEKLYKKDIDIRLFFQMKEGVYNFKITHQINIARNVEFIVTLKGVHEGIPLILRRFIICIRENRYQNLYYYGLELEVIHKEPITHLYKFKPISTKLLIEKKFHCDGGSIWCGKR